MIEVKISNIEIGDKIAIIRNERRISKKFVANYLNLTQPAYAKLESGKTCVKLITLIKIAVILEQPLINFLPKDYLNFFHSDDLKIKVNELTQKVFLYESQIKMYFKIIESQNDIINEYKKKEKLEQSSTY